MKTSDTYTEKIVFNYVIRNKRYLTLLDEALFEDSQIKKIFELTKGFFQKYTEVPSREQIVHLIQVDRLDEELPVSVVNSIYDITYDQYEDTWLEQTVEAWIRWRKLYLGMVNGITYMKTANPSSENIQDISERVYGYIRDAVSIDFGDDSYSNFFLSENHKTIEHHVISSGYEFIDRTLGGGFERGTLNILIGQSKVGKSIWLANLAANQIKLGRNVMIVTLELGKQKYLKRLACNLLNVTGDEYESMRNNSDVIKKRLSQLQSVGDGITPYGNLFVKEYPTGSATTTDIESFIKGFEATKGIKIDMVVIDYINIMRNWRNPNTEQTYMKIKQIAEDTRAMMQRNSWVGVSVSQVGRGDYDTTDLGMGSVSESMGLVHTIDSMYGIIQDTIMRSEHKYKLKALALRDSEGMDDTQEFNIDYSKMQIKQTSGQTIGIF